MNELGLSGWRVWLTDLMAGEEVKLTVVGRNEEVDAMVELRQADGGWGPEATVTGALDLEAAMDCLCEQMGGDPDA